MSITAHGLTEAGLLKMPFSAPYFSEKMRLYAFLHQEPEVVAKIQTIFELEVEGKIYKEKIFDIFKNVPVKPYLLREGHSFRLITAQEAFILQQTHQHSEQEGIDFFKEAVKVAINFQDRISERHAYLKLGNAHYARGNYQQAIDYHEKELKIISEQKDRFGEGGSYGNLGNAYYAQGNYQQATTYYNKELKIAKELKNPLSKGRAYNHLAVIHQGTGNYQDAIMYCKKELKINKKLKDLLSEGGSYMNLGSLYQGTGNYQDAITYQEEALKIFEGLQDEVNKGKIYINLGKSYEELGKYQEAITYQEKALEIFERLQDEVHEGKAYINLGNAHDGLGKYQEAITYHEKALKIFVGLQDQVNEAKIYTNLGNAYKGLGKYQQAVAYHEKALKINLKREDEFNEADTRTNLGNVYEELGNYPQAIIEHEKSLEIALKFKNQLQEATAYANLGNTYDRRGDYRSAVKYHEKNLKIALELKDKVNEARAYTNLGNVHCGFGDYYEAIEQDEKALKIALELKDQVHEGKIYTNLGAAYQELREYEKAFTFYHQHLKIALELKNRVHESGVYNNLGNLYRLWKKYPDAILYQAKALKIAKELGDRLTEGKAYMNLGNIYHGREDFKEAISYYEQALKIAEELGDRLDEGRAYGNLGLTYNKIKDHLKSEECFRKGIPLSATLLHQAKEAKWQISLFEKWSQCYLGLEIALLKQGKHDEALEASDSRRARALSSLVSAKDPSKTPLASLTVQKMQALAKKLHTTFIMYSFSLIRAKSPFLQAWVISPREESIPSISYPILDPSFLNPTSTFTRYPYSTEIRRPVRGGKNEVREGKRPTQLFDESLSSWYQILIAPLEKYLPAQELGETLTFIPDDFLAHLPFGAFYNKEEDKYLIENYPVSVAPSIEVLFLLDALTQNDSNEMLLIGNPTTLAKEIDNLKLAEEEVLNTIAPMLNRSQNEVFTQEKATPLCVLTKAPAARLVHIASHGVASQKPFEKPDPHSVFEGLFKLAPDEDHSLGHLHAKEIASMSLKADLVFMSACHLGRGNLKQEGSIGPVWSFLGAGAKSTIASYWPLPEEKTTVTMVETFYRHYLGIETPKLSKAKALQQAILMALETHRNQPKQWGALFLAGLP